LHSLRGLPLMFPNPSGFASLGSLL